MDTSKPDNSEIVHHAGGGTTITGEDAMLYYRACTLKAHIHLYIKTGIIPTRGCGIRHMLRLANEITKPATPYKVSRTEQDRALTDLTNWCATMKAALPIRSERKPT